MTKLRVKWVRSSIGYPQDQKDTIRALGLRKLQHTVEVDDTPSRRGQLTKVSHLVRVEEIAEGEWLMKSSLVRRLTTVSL